MTDTAASPLHPSSPRLLPSRRRSVYMTGIPVPRERRVTRDLSWVTDPDKAAWAYRNVSKIVPGQILSRGELEASALPRGPCVLDEVVPLEDGPSAKVVEHLAALNVDGFLALRGRTVIGEAYLEPFGPRSRHACFSVTKSLVGACVGLLVAEGRLDPADLAVRHLPELEGSGFQDATLRHVLDMTTDVAWNHDRSDPLSAVNVNSVVGGFTTLPFEYPFDDTLAFVRSLNQAGPHGRTYCYNPANTEILGWIVGRISGTTWQDVFEERIWARLGAEHDAFVTVDAGGHGFATAGFSASLRDLGRFGLMLANQGDVDGRQVLPRAWIADILEGSDPAREAFRSSAQSFGASAFYRNHFYVVDADRGEFLARGFGGQTVYVNGHSGIVGVILSTDVAPPPPKPAMDRHVALMRGIGRL